MPYILALDQGTTSSRAMLFDEAGRIASVAQKEFRQIFPKPGWVEHDPNEIWSSQSSVIAEALTQADIRSSELAGIGITNQRETTVVWDRQTGKPIANAIVWQDRRTAGTCDELRERGYGELFQKKTGLVVDAYFAGTKVKWLLDNVAGAREAAEAGRLAMGTVDSWLIWKLTDGNVHVTDASNASRTLLYNIYEGRWDEELLEVLGVPASMLPEVRSSSEVYGEAGRGVFSNPVPIAGVAGDQQAALFGQMCTRPGMAKNTYGTGCFLLLNTGQEAVPSKNRLLTTVAWQIDGKTEYALEGSIFVGGAVVQWLRDGLGLIRESSQVEALARSVADNGGVYLVPAFVGLGAPHWDAYARGTLVGMTRGTTAGHIARAALEGVAYQVADVLDAMQADSGLEATELRVDGGASANDLLMQFQADILGMRTLRPAIAETTASGAAYLAGLATGFWSSQAEIAAQWRVDKAFEPAMGRPEATGLRERWAEALERAKAWEKPQ